MTSRTLILAAVALLSFGLTEADEVTSRAGGYAQYYGNYRLSQDHVMGIDRFITDAGEDAVLISDYQSGVVRRIFPVSPGEFVMGPGFEVQSPAELKIRFIKDPGGAISGLWLQPTQGPGSFAERLPVTEQQVFINDGQVRLAGTLMMPTTKGPHPAIVLLHGSGPLTRYSFGPYPHFFTSLGFAVLIYDKRGAGASTGNLLDASTGALAIRPPAHYPDDLVNDALAVLQFIRQRPEIEPHAVGVWGSSEGGMLATQVAARDKQVAFAINSSGFMGPLWQTLLYQAGATLRARGLPSDQINEAQEFTRLWLKVARTGQDYESFISRREQVRRENRPWLLSWFSGEFTSLEQMRWDWEHILSFSPLPALKSVTCPVLGVFGEQDPLTDGPQAAREMRRVLTNSGNPDVTVKVFRNAGHSLGEMPSGSRMAPGVFATLRSWLLKRVAGS
jgi:uncharacterized protein